MIPVSQTIPLPLLAAKYSYHKTKELPFLETSRTCALSVTSPIPTEALGPGEVQGFVLQITFSRYWKPGHFKNKILYKTEKNGE